ncbi:MAG: ABC transporter permease [Candidatus Heimdallarchaeota archaeon]
MTKKIFRDMWQNKFRSFSIILMVAITVAMLSGLRAGYPLLLATYDLNRETYNVADGRFSFYQPIDQDNVSAIKADTALLEDAKIDRIEGRILIHTELIFSGEKFQAVVIGINYPNDVNQIVVETTSPDITDTNNVLDSNTSCLLEARFAGYNTKLFGQDIALDDYVTIDLGGSNFKFQVKGYAQDSDYLYVVDENTLMPLIGELAIVWIDLEALQNYLFTSSPLINQILFTVNERFDKDLILSAADDLTAFFESNNIDLSSLKFETYDETADYKMFDGDAGSIDKIGTIFGLIGMIVCSIIILNTLSKLINSQRKNIGLFFAMGSKRRKVLTHYILITLILAFFGILLGIPMGYSLAWGMGKMVTRIYNIHQFALVLPPTEFLIGAGVTLGVCLLVSLFSAWPITRVTPREAMTATFTRIKTKGKSVAEKLLGWIPLFKPIHMTVPLREIFLKKGKTLITIFALTTSMVFLVDSLAVEYNMYDLMLSNYTEYNTYDIQVNLETPEPITKILEVLNNVTNPHIEKIAHSEVFVDIYTKISHNDKFVSWAQLACYQENSTLRNFNVIKGTSTAKSDLTQKKVLLGNAIAGKYDIKLNDDINIGILGNYTVEVTGLVGELVDFSVFWTIEAFQQSNITDYFGIPKGYANGIAFTVEDNTNLSALRNEFDKSFNVNRWIDANTALKSTQTLLESFMGIMLLFLIIGIVIGVLFSFQSMYMAFVDRQGDFLAFKAMGTKTKYLRRMVFWESAILSFFGLIFTVPAGYLFYRWSINYMLEDRFYIPMSIPWFTWPIVFVLSLFTLWLATMRLMRRIKKIELHNELRQTGAT